MKRRDKHAHEDVRDLMAELGSLVDDLGLHDGTEPLTRPLPPQADAATPAVPQLAAPPPPSAPVWRSGPEVRTGTVASAGAAPPLAASSAPAAPPAEPEPVVESEPELEPLHPADLVPMWETAAPAETAAAAEEPDAAVATLDRSPLARDDFEAPRPWSPAAAMAVVEPAAPPGYVAPKPTSPSLWRRRPHAFTVVTALAVAVAAAVFAFSRVDLGRTTGPAQPITRNAFAVDVLRTVAVSAPAKVHSAATVGHYPGNAGSINLDVAYSNVAAGDTLQIVILLQPASAGQAAVTVSDETHANLDPGGEMAITVPAPAGGFAPGTYEVRALHDGTLEKSTTFQVG